ncbi:Uncharacterized bacitracin resistance protein [Microbacterium sp. C448]|uniref:hypothetical protein n=1 Tax=Microbacterium TaxID=33882 RepID=UPI0003DE6355|nr:MULTISPECIES: hypothetical protein [Microbacterium]MDO8384613.1 bacitracin resistance protein [Microbacterium sp.]CDJ99729.1 Uncharacterized bacitracin resistance protein [Microbacterium sp. C448]|tara:strand:- start:60 stop:389 length:330 start_codon:yes stop_codon:yes gene_type:complete
MTDASLGTRRTPTWILAVVGGFFGLIYAGAAWLAISTTILLAPLNALGWFIWIFAILFPVIAFAVSFALSYRRGVAVYALVLLAGLGLVAVFWLNVISYTSLNTSAVVG